MNNWHRTMRPIVLALILTAGRSLAGTPELNPNPTTSATPATDLTLSNFFTEGWNQPYTFRQSLPDGAPDLALLRSVTNFLVRVSRTDFSYADNLGKSPTKDIPFVDEYIDYAFNQRFMLSLFGDYTWVNQRSAADLDGAGGGAQFRFQLVDTPTASYDFNFRIDLPDTGIDDHLTKFSTALSGWQDLSQLHAGRLGIYYDLIEESYAGPAAPGVVRNDMAYDVSFAETWTKPSAPIGNLSTFVEFAGSTNVDGDRRNISALTATPGLQFVFGGRNLLILGVDLPLTHPSDTRDVYRFTYIYCF